MSSLSGPLQVVPDIDDQVANPENPQEVSFPAFHRTAFSVLLCQPVCDDTHCVPELGREGREDTASCCAAEGKADAAGTKRHIQLAELPGSELGPGADESSSLHSQQCSLPHTQLGMLGGGSSVGSGC